MTNRIIRPYELKTLDYFNETAKFTEKQFGIKWHKKKNVFVPIDDIVGEIYFEANCPLPYHEGNFPSFYLSNQNREDFHDFNTLNCTSTGCSTTKMDIFTFIMEMTGCDYNEAVKQFADFVGVEVFLGEMD